ncbi:hypothetical protein [Hymenobacter terrenus]|uniref:hypothetical protein n=1 Tax=Hymenobacter terrenus TaxID=1629124 RepID=UPI000619F860|nr:hypothetical protein [Hymenobacter terrenus]
MEHPVSPASVAVGLPLYSARAIRMFSVLPSCIVGGALTAQNLRDIGQRKAARRALWGSISYSILLLWLTSYIPNSMRNAWIPLVTIYVGGGYAGGSGLEAYFSQFVENRAGFPAKSIVKPLVICLCIFGPLYVFIVCALMSIPW